MSCCIFSTSFMLSMRTLIIPGGSGFLGIYTAKYFVQHGWRVIVLSRSAAADKDGIQFLQWDGKTLGDWAKCFEGADAVLNLAGRTVNCRYTEENKRQILDSRVDSTRVLGQAIAACQTPPKVWLNSGSATIYMDTRGDLPANDEYSNRIGDDFSMGVCKTWEKTFNEAITPHTRKIILRTAITLGKGGGAAEPMIKLAKWHIGGAQASGNQFVSWLHVEDFARMVEFLIEHTELSGVFNCAAPNPVTNQQFMRSLRQAVGVSWGLPTAKWMLKLGAALIMKTEVELVLKSRKVVSKRFAEAGFKFKYEHVEDAWKEILSE